MNEWVECKVEQMLKSVCVCGGGGGGVLKYKMYYIFTSTKIILGLGLSL